VRNCCVPPSQKWAAAQRAVGLEGKEAGPRSGRHADSQNAGAVDMKPTDLQSRKASINRLFLPFGAARIFRNNQLSRWAI